MALRCFVQGSVLLRCASLPCPSLNSLKAYDTYMNSLGHQLGLWYPAPTLACQEVPAEIRHMDAISWYVAVHVHYFFLG